MVMFAVLESLVLEHVMVNAAGHMMLVNCSQEKSVRMGHATIQVIVPMREFLQARSFLLECHNWICYKFVQ